MKFFKENMRLVIAIIIALILIVTGVILLRSDKEENGEILPPQVQEEKNEDQLVESTGMTKEEAIKIVKENFGSDNYEFEATATNDGLYKVVVTNIIDKTEIVYYVDPTNGMFYIDL